MIHITTMAMMVNTNSMSSISSTQYIGGALLSSVVSSNHSQGKPVYQFFNNGITNLSNITASNKRHGFVFLFVILAQYNEGWVILQKALDKCDKAQLFEVINVFECMLCFDEWMNKKRFGMPIPMHGQNKQHTKPSLC